MTRRSIYPNMTANNRAWNSQVIRPGRLYVGGDYSKANPTWHEEDSPWKVQQIMRVFDFAASDAPLRICDIGCGVGAILSILDDLLRTSGISAEMTGYDISPDAIERARLKYGKRQNVTFKCCDVMSLAPLDYDLCLLIDVLEHLENPGAFLRGLCARGVREFVVHLPLEKAWTGILRGKTDPLRSKVGHLHFYNKDDALNLLESANLRVNRWVYTPEFDLDIRFHKTIPSVLAYLPRRVLFDIWPTMVAETLGGVSLMAWCTPV